MIADSTTAPVLLLVFNRPETTRRVLASIRKAAPRQLFVAVDGPRAGHDQDAARCMEVLDLIRRGVDWACDVQYLLRPVNLGCRKAISSAISWFFENVVEGIILEDDCLPTQQFFPFCSLLLARYRDQPRIGHIGGFNCQRGRRRGNGSYYFSRYFHIWGWASWRRAWRGYDVDMSSYASFLEKGALEKLFARPSLREFWRDNFDAVARRGMDTWDYQWVYHNFWEDRLAIVPNHNMIENIGFGSGATHTSTVSGKVPPVEDIILEDIVHPEHLVPCDEADEFTYRTELKLGLFHDMKHIIKRVVRAHAD